MPVRQQLPAARGHARLPPGVSGERREQEKIQADAAPVALVLFAGDRAWLRLLLRPDPDRSEDRSVRGASIEEQTHQVLKNCRRCWVPRQRSRQGGEDTVFSPT